MTPVLRRSCGYPNKAAWWRFVFYLLAVAMGIDLGCSPGGFGFRASDFITGGGLAAGLLLRRRGVGASFVSGEPAVVCLQFAPLSSVGQTADFRSTLYIHHGWSEVVTLAA